MTKVDRALIKEILASIKSPSVVTVRWVDGKRTELCTVEESGRRLKSEDYRAGWKACADAVTEFFADNMLLNEKPKARGVVRMRKGK